MRARPHNKSLHRTPGLRCGFNASIIGPASVSSAVRGSDPTMKSTLLIFVLTILISPLSRAAEDIYNPLKVGLRWELAVVLTTPAGRVLHGTMTREITGTTNGC